MKETADKIRLDKEKVTQLLKANKTNMASVSRELGYSKDYLSGNIFKTYDGECRVGFAQALAQKLGCMPELIIAEDEKQPSINTEIDVFERIAIALERIAELIENQ